MVGVQKGKFIKNAAILTATSLLLRTVGMAFRVYLSAAIGAEGMGLYQLIFSVYVLVATFATSGICTAVTRMVSERLECGNAQSLRRTMRLSVSGVLILSAVSVVALQLLADVIAVYWIGDARAAASIRILAFSLPFMGVSSCVRGYFIARRNVTRPSVAQLIEQAVRIIVIVLLIGGAADKGLEYCCCVVLIGDTVAEAASCLFVFIGYRRDISHKAPQMPQGTAEKGLGRRILAIAVPITAGRYLTSLLRTTENLFVPDRLCSYGYARADAVSAFGMLKGMAMPVLFFPASFLTALATLLVPEISSATAVGNSRTVQSAVKRSVEITLTSAAVIAGVFFVCADGLGTALYGSAEVGYYIRFLAPLVPLMYLESVVDGILKGLGQQNHSLGYNVLDSSMRVGLVALLVPRFGMDGFLIVMVISNLLTSLLCLARLLKVSGVRVEWYRWLIRPAVCISLSCLAASKAATLLPEGIMRWVATAALIVVVYAALMWVTGGLDIFAFGRPRAVIEGDAHLPLDTTA